jgi:hypothetical protein
MVEYYQNNLHNIIEVERWAYELIKKEEKIETSLGLNTRIAQHP